MSTLSSTQHELFYWCQETARVPFETGIQRVVRRLADNLTANGTLVVPVGWDNRARQIVCLPTQSQSVTRTFEQSVANGAVLFVAEIPIALIGLDIDPVQLGRAYGLRTVALIHDLIPMKLADFYDPQMVALYRRYYRQFAAADLVIATTHYVAVDLKEFLLNENLRVPAIEVVALPAEFPSFPRITTLAPIRRTDDPLRLLTVATWEPRKNLPRLLRAIQVLSNDGSAQISLDLVGRGAGFTAYDNEVVSLARTLPRVTLRGTVSDAELAALYAECHASIYPSVEEGFGMPILESLWLGRPCLCHNRSSMAEIAPGGGTLMIDMMDETVIVDTLRLLATTPEAMNTKAREAAERPLKTWRQFADDVLSVINYARLWIART